MQNSQLSSGAPGQPGPEAPWYMKYGGKALGALAGVFALAMGLWACITLSPTCLVAGMWQMFAGFVVTMIEAPFLCMFVEFVGSFSKWMEGRPLWNKAALYVVFAIPAPLLCFGVSTMLGSGGLFGVGVIYGIMSLGKKASREEMLQSIRLDTKSTSMKSNLVTEEQPMPMSVPPAVPTN